MHYLNVVNFIASAGLSITQAGRLPSAELCISYLLLRLGRGASGRILLRQAHEGCADAPQVSRQSGVAGRRLARSA